MQLNFPCLLLRSSCLGRVPHAGCPAAGSGGRRGASQQRCGGHRPGCQDRSSESSTTDPATATSAAAPAAAAVTAGPATAAAATAPAPAPASGVQRRWEGAGTLAQLAAAGASNRCSESPGAACAACHESAVCPQAVINAAAAAAAADAQRSCPARGSAASASQHPPPSTQQTGNARAAGACRINEDGCQRACGRSRAGRCAGFGGGGGQWRRDERGRGREPSRRSAVGLPAPARQGADDARPAGPRGTREDGRQRAFGSRGQRGDCAAARRAATPAAKGRGAPRVCARGGGGCCCGGGCGERGGSERTRSCGGRGGGQGGCASSRPGGAADAAGQAGCAGERRGGGSGSGWVGERRDSRAGKAGMPAWLAEMPQAELAARRQAGL